MLVYWFIDKQAFDPGLKNSLPCTRVSAHTNRYVQTDPLAAVVKIATIP